MKHIIADIFYPRRDNKKDYLLCVCGWEGLATDIKAYHVHKKEAPPVDTESVSFIRPYTGSFMRHRIPLVLREE